MKPLTATRNPPKRDYSAAAFFLIAVSFKVPWTAISSLLGQFSKQFNQPSILLQLNIAYFLPSMPMLLLQSMVQEALDRRLGIAKAALIRFIIGLGGLAVLCFIFPTFCHSPSTLLAGTAAVGVFYSIAFGTAYGLVPRFAPGCTVALTTGFVSCGIVVLICDLALKHGPYYTPEGLVRLFQCMAVQCTIGLAAAALFIRSNWQKLALASTAGVKAGSGGLSGYGQKGEVMELKLVPGWGEKVSSKGALSGRNHYQQYGSNGVEHGSYYSPGGTAAAVAGEHDGVVVDVEAAAAMKRHGAVAGGSAVAPDGGRSSSSRSFDLQRYGSSGRGKKGMKRLGWIGCWRQQLQQGVAAAVGQVQVLLPLLRAIAMPAVALLLSVGSSMLAFPFFTYVPVNGVLGAHVHQALFYSRLIGDILGRMVPPKIQISTSRSVFLWGAFKGKLLMLLIPALLQPQMLGGDYGLAAAVAAYWWLSGYINTGAYLVAPKLVPPAAKARAGGLMALCFQCSCFLGLVGAWWLQSMIGGGDAAAAAGVQLYTQEDLQQQQQWDASGVVGGGASALGAAAVGSMMSPSVHGGVVA